MKRAANKASSRNTPPRLRLILARLDASAEPEDMNLPGLVLHPLKGSFKGFWSVSISGNWRVIFRFENGNAADVDYLDYPESVAHILLQA